MKNILFPIPPQEGIFYQKVEIYGLEGGWGVFYIHTAIRITRGIRFRVLSSFRFPTTSKGQIVIIQSVIFRQVWRSGTFWSLLHGAKLVDIYVSGTYQIPSVEKRHDVAETAVVTWRVGGMAHGRMWRRWRRTHLFEG